MNNDRTVRTNKNLACDWADTKNLSKQPSSGHLVEIPGTEWMLWRWICLRGSGFPSDLMDRLAATDAARLADELFAVNRAIETETENALNAFRAEMNIATDGERRKQLSRSLKQLHKGRIPEFAEGPLQQIKQCLESLHSGAKES